MTEKRERLKELEERLQEIESSEIFWNNLLNNSNRPLYEEDMSHEHWMQKESIKKEIRKIKEELKNE